MTDFSSPPIVMDSDGLHIASEEVSKKLERKNISPSLISGLEQCPAKWLGDSFVVRDLIEEEPDNAARRGTLFHKVMEDFFAEEPAARTQSRIKEIVDEVFALEEFADLAEIPDVVAWLRSAINGYYTMKAQPERVSVASIPNDKGELIPGLEVFVKGKIGEAKRETLGFIDRVVNDPRSSAPKGAVIVEDWKSGAKVKRWNPKTKGDEGRGEARQQVIYKELLEQRGLTVTGARLLYPVAQEIVDIDLSDKKFLAQCVSDVEEADAKLDVFTERNTFEYKPSFLCAWCPLAKICPQAEIKPYAKMREAYSKQPGAEVLLEGFELR